MSIIEGLVFGSLVGAAIGIICGLIIIALRKRR